MKVIKQKVNMLEKPWTVSYLISPSDTATTLASSRWGQLTKTDFPSTNEAMFSILLKAQTEKFIHGLCPRENSPVPFKFQFINEANQWCYKMPSTRKILILLVGLIIIFLTSLITKKTEKNSSNGFWVSFWMKLKAESKNYLIRKRSISLHLWHVSKKEHEIQRQGTQFQILVLLFQILTKLHFSLWTETIVHFFQCWG